MPCWHALASCEAVADASLWAARCHSTTKNGILLSNDGVLGGKRDLDGEGLTRPGPACRAFWRMLVGMRLAARTHLSP